MELRRFLSRTPRDALALARQQLGPDAVVVTTRACDEGVEVLALAATAFESMTIAPATVAAEPAAAVTPPADPGDQVRSDAAKLAMSTLSFQDYVRERMLARQRRDAAARAPGRPQGASAALPAAAPAASSAAASTGTATPAPAMAHGAAQAATPATSPTQAAAAPGVSAEDVAEALAGSEARLQGELAGLRALVEQRFEALVFAERLQRDPRQARIARDLLEAGFSPALARSLVPQLPTDVQDVQRWAATRLAHQIVMAEVNRPPEDEGGVVAFVGAPGVGKTHVVARLASAFVARHGSAQLGLVALEPVAGAPHGVSGAGLERLRDLGRGLGVPVQVAQDRATLAAVLELLSTKRLTLIDTAGMTARSRGLAELLATLDQPGVRRAVVLPASQQGDALEASALAFGALEAQGVVITKLDEAVRTAPLLDVLIRRRLRLLGIAGAGEAGGTWRGADAALAMELAVQALDQRADGAWSASEDDHALAVHALGVGGLDALPPPAN